LFGHRLEYPNGHAGEKDLPVAGTFLISNNGTIRLAHVDVDHTCRLDVDDIVDALSELTTDGSSERQRKSELIGANAECREGADLEAIVKDG
jgi:hypothetical protein